MLIALVIVSVLLALSLVANVALSVARRRWREEADDLAVELLLAEEELEEALSDADDEAAGLSGERDGILLAIRDYMDDVDAATDRFGDGLAAALGGDDECDCCPRRDDD